MPTKQVKSTIKYPYLPATGKILYVPASDPFMQAATRVAAKESLDSQHPTGSIIVRDNQIVGRGANGSDYHTSHECERVRLNVPTGQGYELCEGCHPKNHSEPRAIKDALQKTDSLADAKVYLWGHWWCCEACWNAMLNAGITTVYLLEDSEILFNKANPANVLGKQFTN